MHVLEFRGGADVDDHKVPVLLEPAAQGFRVQGGDGRGGRRRGGGGGGGSHGVLSGLDKQELNTPPSITDTPRGSQKYLGGYTLEGRYR